MSIWFRRWRLPVAGLVRLVTSAWFLIAGLAAGVVALVTGILLTIQTPYQVLLPGPVTDVQQVIRPYPKPIKGALYLTTIYSDPASVGEWLYAKVNPEAGIIRREQARPKDVGDREYNRLLAQMMDESKIAAKVVALREAGFDVKISGRGAQIQDLAEGSKARGYLQVKDIVIVADGQPVTTANDLVVLVQAHRPGETVDLKVVRGDEELPLAVPLGESPDEPGRARMGVVVLTYLFQYQVPKEVDLQTKDIGGSSAGLMFALGIYNAVSPEDLVRGRKIAGTGTIATDGKVGSIGGAKYKVAAAEKARATIFLVPRENAEEARAAAHGIRVIPVSSLREALEALRY